MMSREEALQAITDAIAWLAAQADLRGAKKHQVLVDIYHTWGYGLKDPAWKGKKRLPSLAASKLAAQSPDRKFVHVNKMYWVVYSDRENLIRDVIPPEASEKWDEPKK